MARKFFLRLFLVGIVLCSFVAVGYAAFSLKQGYEYKENYDKNGKRNGVKIGKKIYLFKKAARAQLQKELLTNFWIPSYPSNKNIWYFSTEKSSSTLEKAHNQIYSYNTRNGKLSKLYQEEKNRLLRIVGMDGSKLILMYDIIDNSPGPCFSVWSDWENFGYLDINNPKDGLKPYEMPKEQVEKGKKEQQKCIKEEFDS